LRSYYKSTELGTRRDLIDRLDCPVDAWLTATPRANRNAKLSLGDCILRRKANQELNIDDQGVINPARVKAEAVAERASTADLTEAPSPGMRFLPQEGRTTFYPHERHQHLTSVRTIRDMHPLEASSVDQFGISMLLAQQHRPSSLALTSAGMEDKSTQTRKCSHTNMACDAPDIAGREP